MNKWDAVKLKSFFVAKETVGRVKMQLMGCEKTFTNQTYKRIISKIHKKFRLLN
jgi:hypothetical protein